MKNAYKSYGPQSNEPLYSKGFQKKKKKKEIKYQEAYLS